MLDDNEVHSLKIKGNDGKVKFIDITKTDVKELLRVGQGKIINLFILKYLFTLSEIYIAYLININKMLYKINTNNIKNQI